MSAVRLAVVSEMNIKMSDRMPRTFVVSCRASLPAKASNMCAKDSDSPEMISFTRSLMSNMETRYSFIRSMFSFRYPSMPPKIFAAIVSPTLAIEPSMLPRVDMADSTNAQSAAKTSGSVHISTRPSFMPDMLSPMEASFGAKSPSPSKKPPASSSLILTMPA